MLHSPIWALGMAFLPGFCSSACMVYGGRSWLQTPLNGSITRLGQGLVSQCRARHFCYVDQGDSPFVTLVICGKYCLYHPDYLFIFTVLRFCGGPSAGVGLINALWGAGASLPVGGRPGVTNHLGSLSINSFVIAGPSLCKPVRWRAPFHACPGSAFRVEAALSSHSVGHRSLAPGAGSGIVLRQQDRFGWRSRRRVRQAGRITPSARR